MKRQSILSITAAAALALALLPGRAVSQQKTLKEQLVGTWSLISVDMVLADGTNRQLFGPNPKGIAIYTNDGYFSLIQMRADLPRLASRDWMMMMKLTVACTLTSLMLLCTPVLACGTQLNPSPCEPAAGLRQMDGQFTSAPRFRPLPSPRARTRSNRRDKG